LWIRSAKIVKKILIPVAELVAWEQHQRAGRVGLTTFQKSGPIFPHNDGIDCDAERTLRRRSQTEFGSTAPKNLAGPCWQMAERRKAERESLAEPQGER
jgi:hypothetical protein